MPVKMPSNGGENSKNRLEGMFDDRGIDRALEQPKKAEAPSLQEQVKAIRAEVQAAEQRAVDIGQRIITMAETSTNPRLQELKAQSEDLVQAIRSLNTDLLNVMLGEASIETVAKDAKTLTKATGSLFFEEQKQAAAINEEQRLARSVAFREATEAAPAPEQAQIEPAAKPVATAEEMKPAEAGTEAAPAPETTTESKEYNRQSFWSELKQNMGDRSKAELPFRQVLKTVEKLELERQAAEANIAESEKAEQTPESLIKQIADLHRSLGGESRSEEVRAKLEGLMKTQADRNFFSSPFGPMDFIPMKRDLGKEGLAKRFAELKAEADKASKLGSLFEKMKALAGLSEFRVIESRKRQQEAALATLMDNLIELMQNKNKVASIDKRLDALNKEKESLSFQLGYDTEMFDMVERGDAITKDIENTERRLAQCLARMEDTPAKAKLKDGYPFPIPEELTHFLSPQQIDEYSKLAQHREELQQQLNAHIDETRQLFEGGVGGFTNRKIDEQMAKEAEEIVTAQAETPEQVADEQDTQDEPATTETDASTVGAETVTIEPNVSAESDKDKVKARQTYFTETNDKLREVLMKYIPENADNITYLMGVPFEDEDEAGQTEREIGNYLTEPARKIIKGVFNDIDGIDFTNRLSVLTATNRRREALNRLEKIMSRNRATRELPDDVEIVTEHTGKTREEQLRESKQAIEKNIKERNPAPAAEEEIVGSLPPAESETRDNQEKLRKDLDQFIFKAYDILTDKNHTELLASGSVHQQLKDLSSILDKEKTLRTTDRKWISDRSKAIYEDLVGHAYTDEDTKTAAAYLDKNIALDMKSLLETLALPLDTVVVKTKKGPRQGTVQPKNIRIIPGGEDKKPKQAKPSVARKKAA